MRVAGVERGERRACVRRESVRLRGAALLASCGSAAGYEREESEKERNELNSTEQTSRGKAQSIRQSCTARERAERKE